MRNTFFPTCQVRVVRFYVSCLLLSSSPLLLLLLNRDPRRTVFSVGPQPRPSTPSVPCRTSTTTIPAQCSLPDLNHDHPRPVFPAGPQPRVSTPSVGRYGTKNVQKKVRKNVRQVCYILLANSRVCGRVTGAMPLLTLQVAKFEAISLNRWQSHWGGQRHFHFCTFGAVCKDAWDRQHLTASYYKLLEVISCWIDAWDSQHHTGFLLCITAMVAWWICDIGTFVGAFEPSSTRSRARGRMDIIRIGTWNARGCRLVASHLCHADACPQTEESHLAGVHGASGGAFTQRPSYLLARTDWQVGNQSCFDAGAAAVLACLWCIASILTQCSASGT